jgi:peptidyl-prolyl cis-trans isomerase B (cyclophilin B)
MILTGLMATTALGGCSGGSNDGASDVGQTNDTGASDAGQTNDTGAPSIEGNPIVEITMEDGGVITLELDSESAPKTVANFVKLVKSGFYDGLTFHRIIENFMIQGGDPDGNGTGGSDESIEGEFSSNGYENPIKHTRGVISMARSNNPNSARSQFFITTTDYPSLDGEYAAFGHVTSGMDVVDRLSKVATDSYDRPLTPVVIKVIRIVG